MRNRIEIKFYGWRNISIYWYYKGLRVFRAYHIYFLLLWEFEKNKEKFYEEVVFSDQAPDIEEYKSWYETIDAENAEVIYKQVVEQTTQDEQIKEYANTYSSMKAKEAAGIFDSMTDNLKLVAKILNAMDAQSRGDILGKMKPDTAAKVTKIMNPD